MRLTRRQNRMIALLTSICLLVTQAVLAVHACTPEVIQTAAQGQTHAHCDSGRTENSSANQADSVSDELACNDHCMSKTQAELAKVGSVPGLAAAPLFIDIVSIQLPSAHQNFRTLHITAPPNITPSRLLI